MTSSLYVVIPVHNRRELTRRCLECLSRQTAAEFEIVVVDDGSSDGTAETIRREFPRATLLPGDGDLWWSGATNLGVAHALERGATHILCLNDDTLPPADFIERLLAGAASEPGCLIGAAAVDAATGRPVFSGERIRWWSASYRPLPPTAGGTVEVTHAPGRGLLIPAGVFRRIGLFDARHFPQYAADYDFTHRARRAGYRILCDRSAVLRTYPEASSDVACRSRKSWSNYHRHLFHRSGGGNLRVFFWYALRNCPLLLLPVCLTVGILRRVTGYLAEWALERRADVRWRHAGD